MGKYRFLDHTADIAVEVNGTSTEELFLHAALAWKESVTYEFTAGTALESMTIKLSENTLEELLVAFLSELNFLLSAKKWMLYSIDKIHISEHRKHELHLDAAVKGEEFDSSKHDLKEEIKAVTFHNMKIEKTGEEYTAVVVFDI